MCPSSNVRDCTTPARHGHNRAAASKLFLHRRLIPSILLHMGPIKVVVTCWYQVLNGKSYHGEMSSEKHTRCNSLATVRYVYNTYQYRLVTTIVFRERVTCSMIHAMWHQKYTPALLRSFPLVWATCDRLSENVRIFVRCTRLSSSRAVVLSPTAAALPYESRPRPARTSTAPTASHSKR